MGGDQSSHRIETQAGLILSLYEAQPYRAHAARRADPGRLPARAKRDAMLMAEIRRVHAANFGVYGVRKVWRQLAR